MEPIDFAYLRKIATVRHVVELGSLSEAARLNRVSVSAISQAIASLEQALDRKLFVRDGRNLKPTQHCVSLLESATPAFDALDRLNGLLLPPMEAPPIAWLDFGVSQCIAAELLPRLVGRVWTGLPDVKLKLQTGRCPALLDLVKRGRLCMAVIAADETPRGVSSYPIYRERLGLYFASGRDFAPEKIGNGGYGGLSADSDGHPVYYTRFLRAAGLASKPKLACDSYESLYDIAAAGVFPTVLPERLAKRSEGVLVEVTPEAGRCAATGFSIYLVSQKACDPKEDEFLLLHLRSLL